MTNRFYNESFTVAIGQLATGAAHEAQYVAIQAAFDRLMSEVDAIEGAGGVTGLTGFPASFFGAAGYYCVVNAAESAVEFIPGGRVGIKSIGGTTYTLLATDAGKLLIFTNAAAVTVTVPVNTLFQGDVVCCVQGGLGQVTLSPASGVTFKSSDSLTATRTQYAQLAAVCHDATTGANVFGLIGERNAASLSLPLAHQLSCSDLTTALTVGVSKAYLRAPAAFTLTAVRASLLTVSTSGLVTVDVNKNGVSIFSTKLTIDANEKTSVTAATAAVITTTAFASDDEITINIDGAGTGAKGLIVALIGTVA